MDGYLSGWVALRGSAGRSIQARLRGVAELRRRAEQARRMEDVRVNGRSMFAADTRTADVLRERLAQGGRLTVPPNAVAYRTTRLNSFRRRKRAEPQVPPDELLHQFERRQNAVQVIAR